MISHPTCSYTGTVIFFPLRSEIYITPPLETGWTQYGSNRHLNRKVKDDMHKSVYALSLEKRSFLEPQCGFFLYQSMMAQGCRTLTPSVDSQYFVLLDLWVHWGLTELDCTQLEWFGLAAHTCPPSLDPAG